MRDTNVGLGMVPHKKSCRCDECEIERLRTLDRQNNSDMLDQMQEIGRLRAALSWLCSEVERDQELGRLSIDSEDCAKSARELLKDD